MADLVQYYSEASVIRKAGLTVNNVAVIIFISVLTPEITLSSKSSGSGMYLLLFLTTIVSGVTVNPPDGPQGPPGAILKVLRYFQ